MFCVYIENKEISPTTTNPHLSFLKSFTDFYLFGDAELFILAKRKDAFDGSVEKFFDFVKNMLKENKAGKSDRIDVPLFLDWDLRMHKSTTTEKKEISLSSILDRFGRHFDDFSFLGKQQKNQSRKDYEKEKREAETRWYEYLSEHDIWGYTPKQLWFPLDEDIDGLIPTTILVETGNEQALLAESLHYFYYFSFATS